MLPARRKTPPGEAKRPAKCEEPSQTDEGRKRPVGPPDLELPAFVGSGGDADLAGGVEFPVEVGAVAAAGEE
jgi:hypothetical protein